MSMVVLPLELEKLARNSMLACNLMFIHRASWNRMFCAVQQAEVVASEH